MSDPEKMQVIREYIMALVKSNGTPVIGRTLFTHMIFRIFKDISPECEVSFFPYAFGPYSNDVAREFNLLIGENEIEASKQGRSFAFTCTQKGLKYPIRIPETKLKQIHDLKIKLQDAGLKKTIAATRTDYPQYMVYSRV